MMDWKTCDHPFPRGFSPAKCVLPVVVACLISYSLVSQELTIYTSGFGENAEVVRQQAVFYAEKLGIVPNRPMTLMIAAAQRLPTNMAGFIEYEINEVLDIHNVIIKINAEIKNKKLGQTLAHEMAHLAQYTEGKLERIDGKLLRWQGQLIFDANKIPYNLRSWEIDAFNKEKILYRAYKRAYSGQKSKV